MNVVNRVDREEKGKRSARRTEKRQTERETESESERERERVTRKKENLVVANNSRTFDDRIAAEFSIDRIEE